MENTPVVSPIADRIRRLFKSRHLPEQVALSEADLQPRHWADLEHLQYAIYCLDSYFETNWQLSPDHLERLWVEILHFVQVLAPAQDPEEMVLDIRRYQRLEEGLRVRNYLLPSIRNYYWLKTCDVRLSRKIIEMRSLRPDAEPRLEAWNCLDLLAELGDDLDDLSEDIDTFNGNRFLLAVGMLGADAAVGRCLAYIRAIRAQFIPRCDSRHDPVLTHIWQLATAESRRIEQELAIVARNRPYFDKLWQRSSLGELERLGVIDASAMFSSKEEISVRG